MSVDHEREVCEALDLARSAPTSVDTPLLGASVIFLIKETLQIPVSYIGHQWGEIRFNAGCVSFRLSYPPKARKVKLEYRHMEGQKWLLAKFDNRRNKARHLLDHVKQIAVTSVPSPME